MMRTVITFTYVLMSTGWNAYTSILCSASMIMATPFTCRGQLQLSPQHSCVSSAPTPVLGVNIQKMKTTTMYMIQKDSDIGETNESQRYNDDAFGLVFLIGGFGSKDVVFSTSFLILSALAALATSKGALKSDPRIPGVLAISSLLVTPVISSLTSTASLDHILMPSSLEIIVSCISLVAGFYKWKKVEN